MSYYLIKNPSTVGPFTVSEIDIYHIDFSREKLCNALENLGEVMGTLCSLFLLNTKDGEMEKIPHFHLIREQQRLDDMFKRHREVSHRKDTEYKWFTLAKDKHMIEGHVRRFHDVYNLIKTYQEEYLYFLADFNYEVPDYCTVKFRGSKEPWRILYQNDTYYIKTHDGIFPADEQKHSIEHHIKKKNRVLQLQHLFEDNNAHYFEEFLKEREMRTETKRRIHTELRKKMTQEEIEIMCKSFLVKKYKISDCFIRVGSDYSLFKLGPYFIGYSAMRCHISEQIENVRQIFEK